MAHCNMLFQPMHFVTFTKKLRRPQTLFPESTGQNIQFDRKSTKKILPQQHNDNTIQHHAVNTS